MLVPLCAHAQGMDSDGDGLSDDDEMNLYGTDPYEWDSDFDGYSDGEEVLVMGTDPNDGTDPGGTGGMDSDGDGLSDDDEDFVHGTDSFDPDTDGDGYSDGYEVLTLNTNPNDASDPPPNQAPTVNAGADQTITLPATASLSGSATDDGLPGGSLTYSWATISGPTGSSIANSDQAAATATFTQQGVYVIRLTVGDGALNGTDDITVTVNPPANQAPVADAGADITVNLPNSASLVGGATDDGQPTGSSLSYLWSPVSGPDDPDIATALSSSTTVTFPAAGVYVLRLSVSDSQLTGTDDIQVTVNPPPNTAPTAAAGSDLIVHLPDQGVLDGSGSSDDGLPTGSSLSYDWSPISGPATPTFVSPTAATTGVDFPVAGEYVIRLSVGDSELSHFDDIIVTANSRPTVALTAPVDGGYMETPALVTLTATASDTDGYVNAVVFYAGTTELTTLVAPPYTYDWENAEPGTYSLTAKAVDDLGGETVSDAVTFTINPPNSAPIVNAGKDQSIDPGVGGALAQTTLAGAASDDGLPVGSTLGVKWTWVIAPDTVTFADDTEEATTVTFGSPGIYVLRLTGDDTLLKTSDDVTVEVRSTVNQLPVVSVTSPLPDESGQSPATFSIVADASDPDGTVVSVEFYADNGEENVLLGEDVEAPFEFEWTDAFVGVHTITARAIDNHGGATVSAGVDVVVTPGVNQEPIVFFDKSAGNIIREADGVHYVEREIYVFDPASAELNWVVIDDGLPASHTLTNSLTVLSGASPSLLDGMDFSEARSAVIPMQPPPAAPTPVVFQIEASDGEYAGYDTIEITFMPSNGTPAIQIVTNALTLQLPANTIGLDALVTDDGQPFGDLNHTWKLLDGPYFVDLTDAAETNATALFHRPGSYSFRLTADDGFLTNHVDIAVEVLPDNQAPVAEPKALVTLEDVPVGVTLEGTDFEDDPLTFTVTRQPTHGTLTGTAPGFTYTPNPDFNGHDVIKYRANDGQLDSEREAMIVISVVSVNDPPAFTLSGNVNVNQDFLTTETVTIAPGTQPWDEGDESITYSLSPESVDFAKVSFDAETGVVSVSREWYGNGAQVFTVTADDGMPTNNVYQAAFTLTVNGSGAGDLMNLNFGAVTTKNGPAAIGNFAGDIWNEVHEASNVLSAYVDGNSNSYPTLVEGQTTGLVWAGGSRSPVTVAVTNLIDAGSMDSGDAMLDTFLSVPVEIVNEMDPVTFEPIVYMANPSVVIGGLPPASYDFLFYGLGQLENDSEGFRITVGTGSPTLYQYTAHPGGVEGANANWAEGVQYVRFTNVVVNTGDSVRIEMAANDWTHFINGIQIQNPNLVLNQPPIVDAGLPQIAVPDASVFLSATVIDDNLPQPYQPTMTWSVLAGPGGARFSDPSNTNTVAYFSAVGTYTVLFTVDDDQYARSDSVTIKVVDPPNEAPLVNAGQDQVVNLGDTVNLAGSSFDDGKPVGALLGYWWTNTVGNASIANPVAALTTVTFSQTGAHQLKLEVNDSDKTGEDRITFLVNDPLAGDPPTVSMLSPTNYQAFTALDAIVLSATASDTDGIVDRVEFYTGDDLIGTVVNATGTMTTFDLNWTEHENRLHIIHARTVDDAGNWGISVPITVTVAPSHVVTDLGHGARRINDEGKVVGLQGVWMPYGVNSADGEWMSMSELLGMSFFGTLTNTGVILTDIDATGAVYGDFQFNYTGDMSSSGYSFEREEYGPMFATHPLTNISEEVLGGVTNYSTNIYVNGRRSLATNQHSDLSEYYTDLHDELSEESQYHSPIYAGVGSYPTMFVQGGAAPYSPARFGAYQIGTNLVESVIHYGAYRGLETAGWYAENDWDLKENGLGYMSCAMWCTNGYTLANWDHPWLAPDNYFEMLGDGGRAIVAVNQMIEMPFEWSAYSVDFSDPGFPVVKKFSFLPSDYTGSAGVVYTDPISGEVFYEEGPQSVHPLDMNAMGQAVGEIMAVNPDSGEIPAATWWPPREFYSRAFIWDENNSVVNLGVPAGYPADDVSVTSIARGINNRGRVVGSYWSPSDSGAFLWTPFVDNGTNGTSQLLWSGGDAHRIDDDPVDPTVVGEEPFLGGVLYRDSVGLVDLDRLVPSDNTRYLGAALDVNNAGQIVGEDYLLTPYDTGGVVIVLTEPAFGDTFEVGMDVPLEAIAYSSAGSVTNVEFRLVAASTTTIGSVDAGPFEGAWGNPPAGRYTIVAEARDSEGNSAVSLAHVIRIDRPNAAPVVDAGPDQSTSLPFAVQLAGGADDDGLPVGAPLTYHWTVVAGAAGVTFDNEWAPDAVATFTSSGSYTLRLTVDDTSLTGYDEIDIVVHPTNTAPTVTVAGPTECLVSPASVQLTATATDSDGQIDRVEFYEGTNLWGTVTGDLTNYSFTMTNVMAGTYSITAVAHDNIDGVTVSSPATVTVNPAYELTDLGKGEALGLNNVGEVVGRIAFELSDTSGFHQTNAWTLDAPFMFKPHVPNSPFGAVTQLGLESSALGGAGSAGGTAFAVNERGEAVGNAVHSTVGWESRVAAYWTTNGDYRDVRLSLNRGDTSYSESFEDRAQDINNLGDIAGTLFDGLWFASMDKTYSFVSYNTGDTKFAVGSWNDFTFELQSALGVEGSDVLADLTTSSAAGVNDAGQIAGAMNGFTENVFDLIDPELTGMAFQYSRAYLWSPDDGKVDLGVLGGDPALADSGAEAINEAGDVVGWSETAEGFIRAFLWRPYAPNVNLGSLSDIGTLPGFKASWAYGLNDGGSDLQVVGYSSDWAGDTDDEYWGSRAFVYDVTAGMRDLNTLIPTNFFLIEARAVNDRGQIAAIGLEQGQNTGLRAILLTPNPCPDLLNASPTATIASPVDSQIFSEPGDVTITATVDDSDGTVTAVEFYADLRLLGSVAPSGGSASIVWQGAPAGAHTLAARAVDDQGGDGMSLPVSISIGAAAGNTPPVVRAGDDQVAILQSALMLLGSADDDGNPQGGSLSWFWTQESSKGEAIFADRESAETTVVFTRPGRYVLRLTVSDGQLSSHDEIAVDVYEQDHFEWLNTALVEQSLELSSGKGVYGGPDTENAFTLDGGVTWSPAMIVTNDSLIGASHSRVMGTKWISVDLMGNQPTDQPARYRSQFVLPANATDPHLRLWLHADDAAIVYLNGHELGRQPQQEQPENYTHGPDVFFADQSELFFRGRDIPMYSWIHDWTNTAPEYSIVLWTNRFLATNWMTWTNARPWTNFIVWDEETPGTNVHPDAGGVAWTNNLGPLAGFYGFGAEATPWTNLIVFTNVVPSRFSYSGTEHVAETNLLTSTNVVPGINSLEFSVANYGDVGGLDYRAEVFYDVPLYEDGGAPEVRLTLPDNLSTFPEPATVTWRAQALATVPERVIEKVEFFSVGDYATNLWDLSQGLIGQGSPVGNDEWEFRQMFLPAGSYYVAARATDSAGAKTMTQPRRVDVLPGANQDDPLYVRLLSPVDSGSYTAPTNVFFNASVAINDTNLTVARVEFYANGELIGEDDIAPSWQFDWKFPAAGAYTVLAVAYDQNGDSYGSTPARIEVGFDFPMGQLVRSETDISIPTAGLPLEMVRVFDNRDSAKEGDFGKGWSLASASVRIEVEGSLATGWELGKDYGFSTGLPGGFTVRASQEHKVKVTLPGGLSADLVAKVLPDNGDPSPTGYPESSHNNPVASDLNQLVLEGADDPRTMMFPVKHYPPYAPIYLDAEYNGNQEDGEDGCPLVFKYGYKHFNPSDAWWKMTNATGQAFLFDNRQRLVSMSDRNGNKIEFSDEGLSWSNPNTGAEKRVVTVRDPFTKRITALYDPMGLDANGAPSGLPIVKYFYTAEGRLDRVWRLTDRNDANSYLQTSYVYDDPFFPGYLTEIRKPLPYDEGDFAAERFTYDDEGRLELEIDPENYATRHVYDRQAMEYRRIDKLARETITYFDSQGRPFSSQNAMGETESVTYNEEGQVASTTDAQGLTSTMEYDEFNRVTNTVDHAGVASSTEYGDFDLPVSSVDPSGNATSYDYDDGAGNLRSSSRTVDGVDLITAYGYDQLGNQIAVTNNLGTVYETVTINVYNEFGWLTNTLNLNLGLATTHEYDANGNRTRTIVHAATYGDIVTTTDYDAMNRSVSTTDALSQTTQTEYDNLGRAWKTTDAFTRVTHTRADLMGRQTNVVYPDWLQSHTVYDPAGRREFTVDRAGRTNSFQYDDADRLLWTVRADNSIGSVNAYNSEKGGRLESVMDPNGRLTAYGFDAKGQRVSVTNGFGSALEQVVTYGYDAQGRQEYATNNAGLVTKTVYDDYGRVTQTIQDPFGTYGAPVASITVYDPFGHVIERREPVKTEAGVTEYSITGFGYDVHGRLTSVTNAVDTADEVVTTYGYDELGNQTSQTDARGKTTTYAYDVLGRRLSRTLPELQTETLQYDAVGNLTNRVDFKGVATHFKYDEMNRLTHKWSGGTFESPQWWVWTEYNADGSRRRMLDTSGVTEYLYDVLGRLTDKKWTPVGQSAAMSLTYSHKPGGEIESIASDTVGGARMVYGYDALNRLKTVTDHNNGVTLYNYTAAGSLDSFKLPNNIWHTYNYDPLNRLDTLSVGKTSLGYRTYDYEVNLMGHRTSVTEDGGRTVEYEYDKLHRLTKETVTGDPNVNGALTYTYDNVGNRKTRTATGDLLNLFANQSFNYTDNDLFDHAWATYDANGNTLRDENVHAALGELSADDEYDFENRLIKRTVISNGQVTVVELGYDGDGNRVSRTVTEVGGDSTTTFFLVDTQNPTGYAQVIEEHVSLNSQPPSLDRLYAYGHDLLCMEQDTATGWKTSFYGYDGHGNVRQLFDIDGAVVTDTYDYDAFGNLIAKTGSTDNDYLYTGEQFDPHLGLYHLRARYNNVATGRFWTMDEYEGDPQEPATLHKYLYTHANPINFVDPSGNAIGGAIGQLSMLQIGAIVGGVMLATVASMQLRAQVGISGSMGIDLDETFDEWSKAGQDLIRAANDLLARIGTSVRNLIAKGLRIARRSGRNRRPNLKVIPMPRSIIPAVAAHVNMAQLLGYPRILTRATVAQKIRNRRDALKNHGRAGRLNGVRMSWDEYPFAGSNQGGFGASVVSVPLKQNSMQGTIIGACYLIQKIKVNDPYLVVVTP